MGKEIERRLNFFDAGVKTKLTVSPEDIPTLVPLEILKKWQVGDEKPYYKIQMIEFPIKANGVIYEESFFKSFINKTKERPIPGSKAGHSISWGERPATDLLMIGGKIESNGDGTGRAFFKNYIPPVGETGSNEIFIRENESDMVHYSLVTYPKELRDEDNDGNIVYHAIESMFGERNDAVEYNTGAMKQVTNKNGEVFADGNNQEGAERMEPKEMFKRINTLMANGDLNKKEVAEALGIEQVNESHTRAVNALKETGVEDPVKEINRLKAQIKEGSEAVRNAYLTEAFGAPIIEGDSGDKNLVRVYAEKNTKDLSGEELTKAINSIKEDPIVLRLAQDAIDPSSNSNVIKKVTNKGEKPTSGPEVVEY